MKLTNRILLLALFAPLGAQAVNLPINPGPYTVTMDSLTNYSCPEWFRDAKLGIWAVGRPGSVPMQGDWYARRLYLHDDVDKNSKVIARTPEPIMSPEAEYEWKGLYPHGVAFPTANVVVNGKLFVYYGGADKFISVATANFDKLVNYVLQFPA